MIEFKVTLSDQDYLHFNWYQLSNSAAGKRALLSYRLILPVILYILLFVLFVIDSDFKIIFFAAIVVTIMSALWVAFSKKTTFNIMKNDIERIRKEGIQPYNKDAILRFDDEGIHAIIPNFENKSKYALIEKIAVTENAIYIFISAIQAYILPVTTFKDEAEKLKFLDFIELKSNVLREIKS
ncbi:YcxB family protein [Youngiibacter fragilis]|uniref:YcxB family protein n=1 Tax=Youngiibacter fragilis TaxID=1408819 RepID=UPI001364AC19|nr:YcxB family protein [Youngiibacter fragilis]